MGAGGAGNPAGGVSLSARGERDERLDLPRLLRRDRANTPSAPAAPVRGACQAAVRAAHGAGRGGAAVRLGRPVPVHPRIRAVDGQHAGPLVLRGGASAAPSWPAVTLGLVGCSFGGVCCPAGQRAGSQGGRRARPPWQRPRDALTHQIVAATVARQLSAFILEMDKSS